MKSRSARSLAVSGATPSSVSGKLSPLSARNLAPLAVAWVMATTAPCGPMLSTAPPAWPSSNHTGAPGTRWSWTEAMVQVAWAGYCDSGRKPSRTSSSRSPRRRRSWLSSARTSPVRHLGPGRSISTRTSRRAAAAAARTLPTIVRHAATSSWAQLIRATSMPSRT